ncbi:hypothetical protein KIN20_008146 [Parelaphostrongylus tenuis]|uniref:Uncharacterized protein n=1 Tax=Parelaphostrongylus tenuis TaxID=148309 RepID=A0AAD5M959_PARTN|nr:hypothetical protein KIN20_008146 [Parelaphostrongylus tenuis]
MQNLGTAALSDIQIFLLTKMWSITYDDTKENSSDDSSLSRSRASSYIDAATPRGLLTVCRTHSSGVKNQKMEKDTALSNKSVSTVQLSEKQVVKSSSTKSAKSAGAASLRPQLSKDKTVPSSSNASPALDLPLITSSLCLTSAQMLFIRKTWAHARNHGERLNAICGVPEDSHRILDIEMKVLRACLRSKQDNLYAMLKKCAAKDYYCDQYLEGNLWRRIVGSEEGELSKRQLSNKV